MPETSKTCNLVTVSPFKHAGEHYVVGQVLHDVESDLALELTGAGRTRLASEDDLAAAKKPAKAAKPDA